MRGRKPKPTALKKLEGNPGKRKLNDREPQPDQAMPRIPAGLDPDAKKCWQRLAPKLNKLGILTQIDGDALESYCRLYGHARRCWREAKKLGIVTPVGEGRLQANPLIREAHRAEELLHKLRSELGLNATSRSRMEVKRSSDEQDLDGFLKFDQGEKAA